MVQIISLQNVKTVSGFREKGEGDLQVWETDGESERKEGEKRRERSDGNINPHVTKLNIQKLISGWAL